MTTGAATSRRRWPWVLLGGAVLLAGAAVAAYTAGLFAPPSPPPPAAGPPPDPRLAYDGPYQNVHPDVKYVGDLVCRGCHVDHHADYSEHPMGRSMAPAADVADLVRYDAASRNPFDALGLRFRAVRDGDKLWHQQSAVHDGEVLYELRQPAEYAIGSGTRGYSYIREVDGFVYQTPISWFSEKKIWDLSPGFSPRQVLGRAVVPGCLQCHVNRARTVPGESLRYEKGVFEGHAIGCERCHGPGEKHAAYHEALGPPRRPDPTIVNPARLPAALRDNVCEQCHLQGEARVLRHGRDWFDYRPGLPLEQFVSIFVRDRDGPGENKAVNHVEQMHASTCYQKSAGKLGCISCHDPHKKPAAADRAAFFRGRCVSCHGPGQKECKEPVEKRLQQAPGDSCIDCHMPRGEMTNIAHTSLTDHAIPRTRQSAPRLVRPASARWGRLPLVHFHHERLGRNDPEARRDLGLALGQLMSSSGGMHFGRELPAEALALLEAAVRRAPGDAAAWRQRGEAAAQANRAAEAAEALARCLELWPRDLTALDLLAGLKAVAGKPDEALALRRRLVELLPHNPVAHREVALLLQQAGQWAEARPHAREWARLDPGSAEAREAWMMHLARDGDKAAARREMALLRKLAEPGGPVAQRAERWFERNVGP